MRRRNPAAPRGRHVAWLLLLTACTNDFSRFKFKDNLKDAGSGVQVPRDGGSDTSTAHTDLDARTSGKPAMDARAPMIDAALPAERDTGTRDSNMPDTGAAARATDAGSMLKPDAAGDEDAETPMDGHVPPDAATHADGGTPPDGGGMHEDAGSHEAGECKAALTDQGAEQTTCTACSCNQCASTVLDCLVRSANAYDNMLCAAVYACAMRAACHDWDCYCRDARCQNAHTMNGDGPCAAEMNMAAGGERMEVETAHIEKDSQNPLVRALRAIQCTLGAPTGSIDGPVEARCTTDVCPKPVAATTAPETPP